MSQKPISRSPDLTRLRNEGYGLEIRSDHLLVNDVPYVTTGRIVKRGTLVMPLKLAGDVTVKPENHVAHFIGEFPCRADGTQITTIGNPGNGRTKLGEGVEIDHTFSAKRMPSGFYENYYDKVTQYVTLLSGYAQKIEPGATAKTFRPDAAEAQEEALEVCGGMVRCHDKDREAVYRRAVETRPKRFAIVYTGRMPRDTAIAL